MWDISIVVFYQLEGEEVIFSINYIWMYVKYVAVEAHG